MPKEILPSLPHLALGHEIAIPEVLDAPMVLDDSRAGAPSDIVDTAFRGLRAEVVRSFPRPFAPGTTYSRAYCADGRGILQGCDLTHGKAEGYQKTRMGCLAWNRTNQDRCGAIPLPQGEAGVKTLD